MLACRNCFFSRLTGRIAGECWGNRGLVGDCLFAGDFGTVFRMSKTHAFEFLDAHKDDQPIDFDVAGVYGADLALVSWVAMRLTGQGDVTRYDGDAVRWSDVVEELSIASLFDMGEQRTVVVRAADKFLSKSRSEIEAYLAGGPHACRLILQLDSLASNTKVYKLLDKQQHLICCYSETGQKSGVTAANRRSFLTKYMAPRHQVKMNAAAADALIEMLGHDMGMLDTEIAKLSLYLDPGGTIDEALVRDVVAGWQGKTIWQIIDAITAGDAAEALKQLDKLIDGGQPAIALLPQIAWSLRRLGLATSAHLAAERSGRAARLEESLNRAGITRPNEVSKAVKDMKQMTRARAAQLLPWLLDADLRLKGTHSAGGRDRFLLEQFVLKLAAKH